MTVAHSQRPDSPGSGGLRVGIDATSWANARGYGRFIHELLPRLLDQAPEMEFTCFLDARAHESFDLTGSNLRTVLVEQDRSPTTAAAAGSSRSLRDMWRMTRAVAAFRLDVFFAPTVYTYFPLPPRLRALVGIHDAIADRFPGLTFPDRRSHVFWSAKVWLAIRQARLILTVSEYARDEIVAVLGVPSARIRVSEEAPAAIYRDPVDGADIATAARAAGLEAGARWFIYVGGFSPHKHVDLLVEAHGRAMAGERAPAHLLLVGARSGDAFLGAHAAIEAAIAKSPAGHLVHYTGFLPDGQLRDLMAGALAVVLPSASEGFGLPPVEGAATGTPVIATTASPLPKLLEGGGIFVPPGDVDALAAALRQVACDEPGRRAMGTRAAQRARALRWEHTADRVLEALREAAA